MKKIKQTTMTVTLGEGEKELTATVECDADGTPTMVLFTSRDGKQMIQCTGESLERIASAVEDIRGEVSGWPHSSVCADHGYYSRGKDGSRYRCPVCHPEEEAKDKEKAS